MKNLLVAVCAPPSRSCRNNPAQVQVSSKGTFSTRSQTLRFGGASVILTANPIRLVSNTDAGGQFQFSGLPPGTYRLTATHSGHLDRSLHRSLVLGQDDHLTDAEIRLPPQSVISGLILDENSEPVDRARVFIYKQIYRFGAKHWDRLNVSYEANEAGEYRFAHLSPGRYILQVHDQRPPMDNRYGDPAKAFYVPAYYPNSSTQQQATPVDIRAGQEVRGIDIHIFKVVRQPSVHVRGKVTGVPRDSQIVVAVGLYAREGGFYESSRTVRLEDEFDLLAPPGQYTLLGNVYSGGPEYFGSRSLSVTGDMEAIALTLNPAPVIAGQFTLAEKEDPVGLQGARVRLAFLSGGTGQAEEFELQSNAAAKLSSFPPQVRRPGHFAITEVRSIPEQYFVREVKLGGREVSPDDFEVSSSANLEIVLSDAAGRISGSVTDADNKTMPGATITLIPADGKFPPVKRVADDAGNFQFTSIRPGKYKLFAWEEVNDDLWPDPGFRKRYEGRAVEVTVGAGETQRVQLPPIRAEEMQ